MPAKKITRQQCDAAMMEARKRFGHRQNVTGFDVGYRWIGGKRTDELCARVHVEAKIPVAELEATEVFPAEIDGVPLDVIQGPYRVGRSSLPSEHRFRSPYLMGGLSCGRVNDGTGTIGAIVIDEQTGRPALLSNWHVLAGARARVGDPVLQPGQADGGDPVRDRIATLNRWMLETGGDAAIAEIDSRRPWLPLQFGSFAVQGNVRDSRLGEILHKSGRTTGQTRARVDGEGLYRLLYEVRPGVQELREIRGFLLVPIEAGNAGDVELSQPGDSGALWHSENSGDAVGLHFGGETNSDPAAEHSIACNLTTVLDRLNVRLATFEDAFAAAQPRGEAALSSARSARGGAHMSASELSFPDWPPYPFPYPWPGTGGPWPWPWPWPIDPRVIRPGRDDPFRDAMSRFTPGGMIGFDRGASPQFGPREDHLRSSRPEGSLGIISHIWPRLQIAMQSNPDFDGARLRDELRTFIPHGSTAAVMARIINRSNAFDDLGLKTVFETDFDGARFFAHICEDIIKVLES